MAGCISTYQDDGSCGADLPWTAYLTYLEYAVTLTIVSSTIVTTVVQATDAGQNLSVLMHGVLCMLIELFMLLCIPMRFSGRSRLGFREMFRFADGSDIPVGYWSAIRMIVRYHLIASNTFVSVSALYTAAFDSVHPGDPFTFPFMDVLPIDTRNTAAYVCKFAVYSLPVYIAHAEVCFLNVTFVYSVGVIKRHCEILVQQVRDAMVNTDDHQKLKTAIVHHQMLLKQFKDMKSLFSPPILLVIAFCGSYFGLSACFVIQAIQHNEILQEFNNEQLFSADKSFKRLSLIMMARLSIPLEYEVGYICTINLNLLVKIIKFSYTWLNVLLASIRGHQLT
ncbi:Olfactory receptor, insect [Cinara cedri]|uniref:Olfactory receptor, insect n=1 Tax=Cinara cedri TaxID=506608 RepID=A0A5E4MMR5_9HEMI|nr:Olfactory receptor, insect [Cinara cedri]